MTPPSELTDRARTTFEAVLRRHLPYLAPTDPLRPADSLRGLGLDSLSVVRLIADVEDELDLELPDDALVPETFETVGSLRSVVEDTARTGAAAGGR